MPLQFGFAGALARTSRQLSARCARETYCAGTIGSNTKGLYRRCPQAKNLRRHLVTLLQGQAPSRFYSGAEAAPYDMAEIIGGIANAAMTPILSPGPVAGASLAVVFAIATMSAPATAQSPSPRLTQQALANAAYPLDVTRGGIAQLKDGAFEDAQNQISVTLVRPQASGDLNGDGAPDAVVTLAVSSGGARVYIAAVLNDGGTARPVASALLGDRVRMRALSVG